MKIHMGALGPSKAGDWARVSTNDIHMPDWAREELFVFLNTPGFTVMNQARMIGVDHNWIWRAVPRAQANLDIDAALENWNSITREDALFFASVREKNEPMPLCSILYMLEDAQNMTEPACAKLWNTTKTTVSQKKRHGPLPIGGNMVPDWFRERVPL